MPDLQPSPTTPPPALPRLVSLCGTWLKPEMQSLYRQVANLRRYQNAVYTETLQHPERFPFEPVVLMERQAPGPKETSSCASGINTSSSNGPLPAASPPRRNIILTISRLCCADISPTSSTSITDTKPSNIST